MQELTKKFNLGLNLDSSLQELEKFFSKNANLISSVYFSLPLGRSYYSRTGLEREYTDHGTYFIDAINIIKRNEMKLEVAFNTELTKRELEQGIEYIYQNDIVPQEIVCMNSSVSIIKEAFPEAKLISSFCNGDDMVSEEFDAIVLGQGYLRSLEKRHQWLKKGYEVVLLLNNGCSFECKHKKCNAKMCAALYQASLKQYDDNEIYARQSFFPFELRKIIENDECSKNYIYKISNRPLGLEYTKRVLDAYANLTEYDETEFLHNPRNYSLFGALTELGKHSEHYQFSKIMEAKGKILQ